MAKQDKTKLVDTRHPEWSVNAELWTKFRVTYEGGQKFINQYLVRFSRRELIEDFDNRKALTYNENQAGAIINIIRNAMTVKLPEINRKGDGLYVELMRTDVDMSKSSMNAFLSIELLPLLLAQGKRFIGVDAPQVLNIEGVRTLADDKDRPYVWAIDAEQVLSWSYDEDGQLETILMHETVDVVDGDTGLVRGVATQFRYMRHLFEGMTTMVNGVVFSGPGVLVRVLNEDDKDIKEPVVLPISRIPIVEFKLPDSLLTDIADMQIALLNLSSTDMSFLFRGNFPIYIEQYDETEAALKPVGSQRQIESFDEEIQDVDRVVVEDERENVRTPGSNRGIGYKKDLDAPTFIAPTTENLKASAEKQMVIAQNMRALVDLSLVSMSIKVVEQSGKSKEADRVGQEAALQAIAMELETGEREIAKLFHEFLGSNAESEVNYPEGFSLKTSEERRQEVKELRELRSAVPSELYAKQIDARITETMLKPITTPDELEAALKEVAEASYVDDDPVRMKAIHEDLEHNVLSKETGTALRGYAEDEHLKVEVEQQMAADAISGGIVEPPPDDSDDGDGDDGDDADADGDGEPVAAAAD